MKLKLLNIVLTGIIVLLQTKAFAVSSTKFISAVDREAAVTWVYSLYKTGNMPVRIVDAFDINTFDVLHGELPADLSRRQLEDLLKENFKGSYVFYQRLSESARQQVYEQYQRHPGLDDLRAAIIRLGRSTPDQS